MPAPIYPGYSRLFDYAVQLLFFIDVRETGFRLTAEALQMQLQNEQDASFYRILLIQLVLPYQKKN